jgi:hypothetical protein
VALWVQHTDKWLLASVRDVPRASNDDRPASYHRLRQLSWLVGEWQEKNGETQLACTWSAGQAFLLLRWTVKQADGRTLQVGQRIGWDPINQRLRSWVFDATGGYGEGIWAREGNTWVVRGEGVYPDGKVATSVTRWKFVDRTTFQWSATGRTVDEMPLPDVEATFVRKPSKGTGR